MALAAIDLSFEGGEFELEALQGRQIEVRSGANQNLIIFLKDIIESNSKLSGNIAVTQRYFDPKARYTFLEDDPSVQIERDVDEYLYNKVYGCQTIVTNCSVANLEF